MLSLEKKGKKLMKKISILLHKKAAALLNRFDREHKFYLTGSNRAFEIEEIRKNLDLSRPEFDAVIQYLSDKELIDVDGNKYAAWILLTAKGQKAIL